MVLKLCFFALAKRTALGTLITVSGFFEAIPGLKINRNKCQILGFNCDQEKLRSCDGVIGCEVGSFPSSYLGLSVGGNLRAISFLDSLLEKIRKRLASWKKSFFSKAGRLTLAKSVLGGILIYYLSLFWALVWCARVWKAS